MFALTEKSEVLEYFKISEALIEKQSGFMLKKLHSNRGSEYMSNGFEEFLKQMELSINSPLATPPTK